MVRRLRQVPLPLGVLLVVAAIQALTWMVLLPPLQGPDEVSHFTYVQRIYERHTIPWVPRGGTTDPRQGPYSGEVDAAMRAGGVGPLAANVAARPLWTRADERAWAVAATGTRRDTGSYTSALRNPPLYYLYEVVPYAIGTGGTFWDRQMLTRLANLPLMIVAVVFIWLLAGELLGRRRGLQFLATAVAAFLPQMLNVVATVNPDMALVAEWSAALYLIVLLLRRGFDARLALLLGAVNLAGILTQPRSVTLVIPSALAVLLAVARARGWRRVTPVAAGVATVAATTLVTLAWAERGPGSVREFVSYVWQFYLPKLGFMSPTIGPSSYDVHSGFVDRIFGTLAQLEVGLPPTLDDIVWWIVRLGLVAIVAALVIKREAVRREAPVAVVMVVALWTLLLGLHLVAYREMVGDPSDPIITGRYLLPLAGLLGIAVAIVADVLPRPARSVYTGVALAGVVGLQVISLGLLLERFYG